MDKLTNKEFNKALMKLNKEHPFSNPDNREVLFTKIREKLTERFDSEDGVEELQCFVTELKVKKDCEKNRFITDSMGTFVFGLIVAIIVMIPQLYASVSNLTLMYEDMVQAFRMMTCILLIMLSTILIYYFAYVRYFAKIQNYERLVYELANDLLTEMKANREKSKIMKKYVVTKILFEIPSNSRTVKGCKKGAPEGKS